MQFFRTPFRSRTPYRAAAVVSCAAVAAASLSACSQTERLTTGMKVRNAVVKLGEQPAATVVASVDGSPRQAREFLSRARGGDGEHRVSEQAARRLARAELTLSAGTGDEEEETPLKEMPASDAANVAAALSFGGDDVAAVKSVDDKLYLRVDLEALVEQAEGSRSSQETAAEIVGLAGDLPSTLGAAKDALRGEWVRADPAAFDDFARAAEELAERQRQKEQKREARERKEEREKREGREREQEKREQDGRSDSSDGGSRDGRDGTGEDSGGGERGPSGEPDGASEQDERTDRAEHTELGEHGEQARRSREIRDAVTIGSALDGQSQREFLSGVQDLLRDHAQFDARGEHAGAEHVRMTLPGRKAAKDIVGALRPLGAEIDPARVPDGDIAADLTIRRGQLTSLTLDLGRLIGGGARLPLRLEFSGGDAVAVTAPAGTAELQPQDLVAAMMYGALGTERF